MSRKERSERRLYSKCIGTKHNKLTILSMLPSQKSGIGVLVECRCDCGKITYPRLSAVVKGKTKSCGCFTGNNFTGERKECQLENKIGKTYGMLTVLEVIPATDKEQRRFLCRCICGKETIGRPNQIYNGIKKTCGCINKPSLLKRQEMFLRFVEKRERCWIWTGRVNDQDGRYGTYHAKRAHRVAYTLFVGEIPKGLHVLHKCDDPRCVSPLCLFLGTAKDNAADMVTKDRHTRGERSPMAKLNESQVRYIREEMARGVVGTTLAEELGVANCTVYNIKHRKRWRYLD